MRCDSMYQSNGGTSPIPVESPKNGELHLFISWVFRGKRRKAKTVKIDGKVVYYAL